VVRIRTGDLDESAIWSDHRAQRRPGASARGGPLQRVFLGDMTYKLLRATPVPAIILPRHSEAW